MSVKSRRPEGHLLSGIREGFVEEVAFAVGKYRDGGKWFRGGIIGTEPEVERNLQGPGKELFQVNSPVSGHRGSPLSPSPTLPSEAQSPGHTAPWQQEPFAGQQASSPGKPGAGLRARRRGAPRPSPFCLWLVWLAGASHGSLQEGAQ